MAGVLLVSWERLRLKPLAEGVVHLSAQTSERLAAGRYVHGFEVAMEEKRMGKIAEAVVDVR